MKRMLASLMAALLLSAPAWAQSATEVVDPFIGGGLVVGLNYGGTAFSFQGGADNLLGPLALRGNLDINSGGGALLGVDILNYFVSNSELAPYAGGGIGVALSGGGFALHGTGGLEYFVGPDIALFAELQPGVIPQSSSGFFVDLRFGANYHLE